MLTISVITIVMMKATMKYVIGMVGIVVETMFTLITVMIVNVLIQMAHLRQKFLVSNFKLIFFSQ